MRCWVLGQLVCGLAKPGGTSTKFWGSLELVGVHYLGSGWRFGPNGDTTFLRLSKL